MKLLFPFFLVLPSILSLDTPASFLRGSTDDEQDRELFLSKRCPRRGIWKSKVDAIDTDSEIAKQAGELLKEGYNLSFSGRGVVLDEDEVEALEQSLNNLDLRERMDELIELRSSGSLFNTIESRIARLESVTNGLNDSLAAAAEILSDLAIYAGSPIVEFLINSLGFLSSSLAIMTEALGVISTMSSADDTESDAVVSGVTPAAILIVLGFYSLGASVFVLFGGYYLLAAIISVVYALLPTRTSSALESTECSVSHLMQTISSITKSSVTLEQRLDAAKEP